MGEFVTANLHGDIELIATLRSLTPAMEKKAITAALRTAGKPILQTARAIAPKETGKLKKSIKQRVFKKRIKGRVGFTIGWYGSDAFYGAFQEYGWKVGKRPWKAHTSKAEVYSRLEELEQIGKTQKFRKRKDKLQFLRQLRAARANVAAREADTRREIPGKFFMRRAFDQHAGAIRDNLRRLILEAVDKTVAAEAAKQAKKAA